jgi:protein-S-isoprenylcysteine O-methyltransferase Ste14
MFVGLFLAWLNVVALVPFAAIPGYARVTEAEEELLTRRFGEEYTRYREKTGRFMPKL